MVGWNAMLGIVERLPITAINLPGTGARLFTLSFRQISTSLANELTDRFARGFDGGHAW